MTPQPISAETLKNKLKKTKLVEIKGDCYRIRKVSLFLLFKDPEALWNAARLNDEAALKLVVAEAVKNPSAAIMKSVLAAGVEEPKLSLVESEDAVSVEELAAHYEIAFPLYGEIIRFTLEG